MEVSKIEKHVSGNLINSSLCFVADKTNYNLKLFKEYTAETLKVATAMLRKKQIVSMIDESRSYVTLGSAVASCSCLRE